MSTKIICVSGGFDPVHVGHLRMMEAASQYGELVVIVNSDDWLLRKKGYVFMPFGERCELLRGLGCVSRVVGVDDSDGSVINALEHLKPDYFANGGDRQTSNTPEVELCRSLGISMLWNIGGDKVQSSSELVNTLSQLP
ncbi:adenylyltransferase/cytidyltransferase family protein [uncultured Endozoicomonas sp.]|uniref:adenylyltransferase/cytidyltransferase family protein n=1 Tax=uncultured Endozoicomonas sp. TaxID=432652 RepID=UPI002624B66D|nr:adenylyltransferase/cytidyltransferase family protein [uncultured Endozoicomonas sp.]